MKMGQNTQKPSYFYIVEVVKHFDLALGHESDYKALHRLEHVLDPKQAIFQGHCSNKLDVKWSSVFYIIVS